jgi:hypothetical protein
MKLLTVATDLNRDGLEHLIYSSQKQGWDIELIVADQWKGFGTKLIETYNYLKENPDVKEFIFVDAYDVVALGTPKEFEEKIQDRSKMLIGVEKACYPQPDLADQYPKVDTDWKYINSGAYFSPSKLFIDMIDANPPLYSDDDQLWLTNEFLHNKTNKVIDYECEVFQSYSFIADDDFEYKDQRVFNKKTYSTPIFLHGNGKTNMDKVIELL